MHFFFNFYTLVEFSSSSHYRGGGKGSGGLQLILDECQFQQPMQSDSRSNEDSRVSTAVVWPPQNRLHWASAVSFAIILRMQSHYCGNVRVLILIHTASQNPY